MGAHFQPLACSPCTSLGQLTPPHTHPVGWFMVFLEEQLVLRGVSWTWWELGAFCPVEKTVQSNINLYEKKKPLRFFTAECLCFETPEYILCKGNKESVRYVNINIYEINPEVSALLWLWMS